MAKHPEEILMDSGNQEVDQASATINNLQQENERLIVERENILDRLNRLESIQNQNRLRKYDERNDPDSLKKTGHVPSMDGRDPVTLLKRSGSVHLDADDREIDEQVWHIKTYGGVDKVLPLRDAAQALAGNSIPCLVNDWDRVVEKMRALNLRRHTLQRATGSTAKVDTVKLFKEIKEEDEALSINVTLSEDNGKSYTGLTLDVPFNDVYDAIR